MYHVYEEKPEGFQSQLVVVACYLDYQGEFLFLKRKESSSQGETWGVPAGKLEQNEKEMQGAQRELFEETSVQVSNLVDQGKIWVEVPGCCYEYHMFYQKVDEKPFVRLNSEHTQYLWVSPKSSFELPLIMGAKEALKILLKRKSCN